MLPVFQFLDDLFQQLELGICSPVEILKVFPQDEQLDRLGADQSEDDDEKARRIPFLGAGRRLVWIPGLTVADELGDERGP